MSAKDSDMRGIGFLAKLNIRKNYKRYMNNLQPKRLDWEEMEPQGGVNMVKGISRRVVVIKSPDPKVFEEAIFIVREDFLNSGGMSSEELVKEAQRVADLYVKSQMSEKRSLLSRLPAPVFAAAGAAATGIAWLAMHLFGVLV